MFRNLKIGVRLAMAFGAVLLLLVLVSWEGINSMGKMDTSAMHIVKRNYARIEFLSHAKDNLDQLYQSLGVIMAKRDKDEILQETKKIESFRAAYRNDIEAYEKIQDHKEGLDLLAKLRAEIDAAKNVNNEIIKLSLENKPEDARRLYLKEGEPRQRNIQLAMAPMAKYEEDRIAFRYKEAVDEYGSSMKLMLTISGVAAGLVILLSFLLTKGITKPLKLRSRWPTRWLMAISPPRLL